jgi:hypothetical protein
VNSAFVKATCGQLDSEAALRAVVEPSGPEMLTTLGRAASASVIGGSASVLGGSASVARGSVIGAGRASQAGLPRQGSVAAGRRAAEAVSEVPPEPRQFGPPSALNPVRAPHTAHVPMPLTPVPLPAAMCGGGVWTGVDQGGGGGWLAPSSVVLFSMELRTPVVVTHLLVTGQCVPRIFGSP